MTRVSKETLRTMDNLKTLSESSAEHLLATDANGAAEKLPADDPRSLPFVLFFLADWAEQCRAMESVVSEMSKLYEDVIFWRVNVDTFPLLSAHYQVKSVPCFVAVDPKLGGVFGRIEGTKPSELVKMISDLALRRNGSGEADLESKCKRLINQAPLMLFIKGTPEAPCCGFTVKLVNLLKDAGITSFSHYNILEDEPLRQYLKVYSQWPTYPQVYFKGELLGGLDILKEMLLSGDLHRIASEI